MRDSGRKGFSSFVATARAEGLAFSTMPREGQESMAPYDQEPILVMVVSPSARAGETSPFLRFVRDYAHVLKGFSLHCTEGTARSVTSTGLYLDADVRSYKPGPKGGMVEVAAIVARGECSAVILLTDALDQGHDEVMTRVVKRIANQARVRLVTTYGDAVLWARLEADRAVEPTKRWTTPDHWLTGISNEGGWPLRLGERTVALTAHDLSKQDMLDFVEKHIDALANHRRILATGATGWMLKLLFADAEQRPVVLADVARQGLEPRMKAILACVLRPDLDLPTVVAPGRTSAAVADKDLAAVLEEFRAEWGVAESPELVGKVFPVLPGPAGGDALLSKEVLDHHCDTVICLHDPKESLPHTDDSQMLEQTCQLRDVFAGCLTNLESAMHWARGVRREMENDELPRDLNDELRVRFGLREVVVVSHDDDDDSDELGQVLCLAAAGYVYSAVDRLLAEGGGRIAVSWGSAMSQVVEQLENLEAKHCLGAPADIDAPIVWSASIGNLPSPHEINAGTVAGGFRDFFGGEVEDFSTGSEGYAEDLRALRREDRELLRALPTADIVLTSASAWNERAGLAVHGGQQLKSILPRFDAAVGNIGGVFLDEDGSEVPTERSIVGLDYEGLSHAAARGTVILVAGGEGRRPVALAALQKRLVSVLVTSAQTAAWLLSQPVPELPDVPIVGEEPEPFGALLRQARITDIDPSRLRTALTRSLQLLRSPGSTTIGPLIPVGGRLTASEVALLEAEGLDLSPLEPGAEDPVAVTAAITATLLANALTIEAAAEHLRTSEADVMDRIRERSLYGVEGALLPQFQFTADGLVPGIDRVLQAAPAALHIVELWGWLTNTDPNLDVGGQPYSPRDWLLSGGDSTRVVELATYL